MISTQHLPRLRALWRISLVFVVLCFPWERSRADCLPLPSGLVGAWSGDGVATDLLTVHPGTLQSSATYTTGLVNQCFSLNGTSSYVDLGAWSPGSQWTVEAWVNPSATPSGRRSVLGGYGGNLDWGITMVDGQFGTSIRGTNGTAATVASGIMAATNTWYHLAGTCDGTVAKIYVNGVLRATNLVDSGYAGYTGGTRIGGEICCSANNFPGRVDEAAIYNRALSAAEVAAIFNAGSSGKCPNPPGAQVPYFTDFESGLGGEWFQAVQSGAEIAGFTRFSGRFGNNYQILTVTNLIPGQSYTLGFDLYVIDSWDGTSGGEYFNVALNGRQLFHQNFGNATVTQGYTNQPDEGRLHFGFNPSYTDSTYRNIEVPFVASNGVALFQFSGQGLEAIDNESWGLDNVGLRLSADLTGTFIRSTTLPLSVTPSSDPIESFGIAASRQLLASSATNAANFSLREAGADGVIGNGDDVTVALTASLPGTGGRAVTLTPAAKPLQPGRYRFQASGLLDTNSSPVTAFGRDFVIFNPVLAKIESTSNGSLVSATPLPVAESPVGSGFFTAFGIGTIASTSDLDYWSFNAEAGDVLTVRLECESQGVYPQLYLQNAAGGNVGTWSGDFSGVVGFQNLTISSPGTYYLRVFSNNNRSRYGMRLDQARGVATESEANDTQASANQINLAFSPGISQGRVVGSIPNADTSGDFFRLGTLNPGNSINVSALFPTGSVLNASQVIFSVQLDGNSTPLATNSNGNLNYTVLSNGVHYVRIETASRALRAQYLLNVAVVDGVPPSVAGTSLPVEGSVSTAIIDRFTLSFSEDLYAASVNNLANYELRGAGADGVFGTADDTLYAVALASAYASGLSASYAITDGPLQVGNYRFTVRTGLMDRASNALAVPFVRNFALSSLGGFVIENRYNDSGGLGTPLGAISGTNANGSFSVISSVGVPAQPYFITAGYLNGDTNLDLVTANYYGNNVTVLTNNGVGTFVIATNIATGNGSLSVTLADFTSDGKLDMAVANYAAGTVSILSGDGNLGFQLVTNLTGFSNPYNLAAADFNNDGKMDLAVPNYSGGNLIILLGSGNGNFHNPTNYATGSNPQTVAAGDLNSDGKTDLVVVNRGSSTATVLLGLGTGRFQAVTNLSTGYSPRFVTIAEVTGDGVSDIVTLQGGENTVSIFRGNGDGTFQARRFFNDNTTDAYAFALTDFNGDGAKDIAVAGYGNNTFNVLLNDGTGGYTNLYGYSMSGNPIGVTAGDFTGDGRIDLAFSHYNGNSVSVWAGNPVIQLAEDPAGSGLRTGFGRGIRSTSSDVDYWRFSANAGDQVMLAVEVPGNPSATSLNYQILRLDGSSYTSFNPDYSGWGQSATITLPQNGTYLIRVASNYDYQGEYRIRITLARPPMQLETEGNNSIAAANVPTLVRTSGQLVGQLAAYLSVGDASDYFDLGNLLGGSTVTLSLREPSTSGLSEVLWIYNASGSLLTNSAAGATNFSFAIPAGQGGVYYVAVTASASGFTGNAETALRFAGGNDSVELGTWFNYQSFTLSLWVSPSASQNTYADIIDNNHRSAINWVIQQISSTPNQYAWGPGDGGAGVPFSLTPNTWQHLAITRDGTNISKVYVNGLLVGSNAAPGQISYDGNQSLRLARWGGGTGRGWNGMMDEVRMFNRDLSAAEVQANMTGSLAGTEPGLVGYWRLNEGSGTNAFDLSQSNRTGLLVSGPQWVFLGNTNALSQGIHSQYILGFQISNASPPTITSVSLPTNNSTVASIITSFSVGFSEDMDPRFVTLTRNVYRYGGHSYVLTDAAGSWSAAEAAAVALGGHLATVNSLAENAWLNQTFSSAGELWLGLNLQTSSGTWTWANGEPFAYTQWSSSQPNNSAGYEVGVKMRTDGNWDDVVPWVSFRGIVEIASSSDADTDGLVDSLDPYPADPMNAFDLRAAGADGLFDTADDVPYRIYSTGYTDGLSSGFAIYDGPLQPGAYRFRVTTALTDRFGNALAAPYERYFTNVNLSGFITQSRRTNGVSGTSLSLSVSNQLDGSFSYGPSYATPSNPHFLTQGNLNGDANLDLITANISADNITIWLGSSNGTFQAATNIATGNGPISAAVADFNGDTKADLAVANYYGHTVAILLGDGNGGFQIRTNYSGFSNPCNLTAVDFNHDGKLDLAVPNLGNATMGVWFGNGDGTFRLGTNYTAGTNPETVAPGDLNGDGQPDLLVANAGSSFLSLFIGNTNGTFQPAVNITNVGGSRFAALGDVNGDTKLDIVAISGGSLSVFLGNGDGTFQPRTDYSIGGSDPYQVALADLNSDGALDAAVASYGGSRLFTLLNNGDGTFGGQTTYNPGGNPISVTVGDYNRDGLMDLATSLYTGNAIQVLFGNNLEGVAYDPAGTGLRVVAGRGNVADGNDYDYWTFSAATGDRLFIASENPGNPSSSQLLYRIYYPDGSQWTYFYTDSNGRGQISLVVPASGTFTIRVEQNQAYAGEYRFRLSLARPPVQLESEDNGSLANANTLTFSVAAGAQRASVLGYLGSADNSDIYRLGNLSAGTLIRLHLAEPATSGLLDAIVILDSAGNIVTNSIAGATNLNYLIPAGADGAYYAQIWDAGPATALTFGGTSASTNFAIRFDGSSAWVSVTNPLVPLSGDYTVEAWSYSLGATGYREMLSQGSGGNAFYLGTVDNRIRAGDGWSDTGVTLLPGGWHHVAVVKTSTNAYLYLDGVLAGTRGATIPNPVAADGVHISRQYGSYGEYWSGGIDEIRVWNQARSATDLQLAMTNRLSGTEAGLVALLRFDEGAGRFTFDSSTNRFAGAFQANPVWLPAGRAGVQASSIFSQYLMDIELTNTQPPVIVSLSLPAEGAVSTNMIDRFTIVFAGDMAAATVTNAASYQLLCAGPDAAFGTGDDVTYTIANSPAYASGTSASYLITDGPVQPGRYRFTARTTLTDKTGNPIVAPYVRNFTVAGVPGFVVESRSNNGFGIATSLSLARTNRPDGSFLGLSAMGLSSSVERVAAGYINGDTNLDVVAALWDAGSVAILLGNGDGTFQSKTNIATGSQAWSVALGMFDSDTNLDLAVINYNANTVSILKGDGAGGFQTITNIAVGSRPYHVAVADLDGDGKNDLVVPNYNSAIVSVLLGNGNDTFRGPFNYAVGASPMYVAIGDINGGGVPDLVVANYGNNSVSLLLGNGDGTFAAATGIATGLNPRALVMADLNKDGKLDLGVLNGGDNTISLIFGNGDGSFQPRVNYAANTSDGYELKAADLDLDGWLDLVTPGYNNSTLNVLRSRGGGQFDQVIGYGVTSQPVGLEAGDFNNDGRPDLVLGHDGGRAISVLLGNDTEPLASDSTDGTIRFGAGRGNVYDGNDLDYWTFEVQADDRLMIAVESPGSPSGSQLLYRIYYPSGSQWTYFYSDSYGRGQISLTAPVAGTYTVRVEQNQAYVGEYRLRVTLARPPMQLESEDNNNVPQADVLSVATTGGHQLASVLGYIGVADSSGDYFNLGYLSSGSFVNLTARKPVSSTFLPTLDIFDSSGTVVAPGLLGASNLSYTVPAGAAGSYYARVSAMLAPPGLRHPGGSANSLLFDGANDYVRVVIDVPESAAAISFWFRTFNQNGGFLCAQAGSMGGNGHDRHLYLSGGNIYSRVYSDGAIGSSGLNLADGVWHNVLHTFGPAIGGQKLYVDGVLVASDGKANSDFNWQDSIVIGYANDAPGGYFNGYMDEVRYFNYAFYQTNVLANLTNTLTGTEPGLIGYWKLNHAGGLLALDSTTNNHNGTLMNGPRWAAESTNSYGGPGLFANYILDTDVADTAPPAITSVSLPTDGSTNQTIIDRFTIGFSKDVDAGINALNRAISTYGGKGYTITDSGSTWYNAELAARALGGHLVAINDMLENSFLQATFSSYGNVWLGLSDEAQCGSYVWTSGESFSFTNWASGQPNNSGNKDYTAMQSDGTWATFVASANYRGVVEVGGADADGDGIPDALDPYPYDRLNVFDLRTAGPDGLFDTADDVTYRLTHDTYSIGLTLGFYVADGPMQPGYYRFTATSSLKDRFGNSMNAPVVRYFTVADVPGYVMEARTNQTVAAATPLLSSEDPVGVKTAAGRGRLFDSGDVSYWSFTGTAGNLLSLAVEVPGRPSGARLHYEVLQPGGARIVDLYPDYSTSVAQSAPIVMATNGTYLLRVTPYDGYYSEYRFRVTMTVPPIQMETEANDSLATANALTYTVNSNLQNASVSGYVRTPTDLDYFNLGTVSNGFSIFLNVRTPFGSTLAPIVSVYNAANAYQAEAPGGRPDDGVAEIRVPQTGTYYAVVRGSLGSGGLEAQDVLDVQVVPTGAVSFPNLQVVTVTPPTGGSIQSGQLINYAFAVQNVGSLATATANWVDRAALSTDTILGNADDIPLGLFAHNGALDPLQGYSVTNSFSIPDGVSGDYYLIVMADAGNAVSEFLFEGDNTTVSASTFHINLAPYPNLRVENLTIGTPDTNGTYSITWNTANRGTGVAPGIFHERFLVRNLNTGTLLANIEQAVTNDIAPGATLAHATTITTTNAGSYQVQVSTDWRNVLYEHDGTSHAAAEADNTATGSFAITAYFNVTMASSPVGAGTLGGGGTFPVGTTVTATAVANTNILPYQFVNWTEGGAFQSASTNYSFILTRDRQLVANFTLPSFQVSVSNNPSGAGTVSGGGTYFYGTTNILTASAAFGYKFGNWTENGSVISLTPSFTNIVTSNRFLVANYSEANTLHFVSTATSPTNIATVTGAGTYTNGQFTTISTPASITNPPSIFNFREFRLNGSFLGTSPSFAKPFSTLDPTNMQFIAYYDTVSILPLIVAVSANQSQPVPAMTSFALTVQFNRTMNTNFTPVILLTNATAPVQAVVPAGGTWSMSAVSNDTFRTPSIVFSTGMDGTNIVWVSGARDLAGGQLTRTNVLQLVVDVTPPLNPVCSLVSSNDTSATVSWSAYSAPADISAFRLYLSTNTFSSVAGMTPVSTIGSYARSFTYYGLSLDRSYFVAVAAVDVAGNSTPSVTTLPFSLPSAVPPPVTVAVAAPSASSATVSWNSYDTTYLLGFAGFRLYYETSNFTSIASLTPKQTLGTGIRSVTVNGLDRTKTNYFAVVGFNGNNAFNPAVTTAAWRDPYAGLITTSLTLGGSGQTNLDILQSITVVSNAVVTIPAGTTLKFAPGVAFTVQQGSVVANGTALDPIVFTSANSVPAGGDWAGVSIGSGGGSSLLRHVFVRYGAGLTVSNSSPTIDAFTALYNTPAGLTLLGSATLTTSNALLSVNSIGARQFNTAQLRVLNSVLKNNATNAFAAGSSSLIATQNWWGSALGADVAAGVQGTVTTTGYLTSEPLLTPAIGTVGNVTQVGSQSVDLRLACRTSDSMRLSEDSTFYATFYNPFTNVTTFPLSAGGGLKTVFVQYRSLTGQTSTPVSVSVTYITAGPTINGFNLSEGQVLTRPYLVTGSAYAPLGMAAIEFYVDNVCQATNVGGSYSQLFDVRGFGAGIHRVKLLARDTYGNFATLERNVTLAPMPPPAPVITSPVSDLGVASNSIAISGTAEPFIEVRLFRSGSASGVTNASAAGTFSFTAVELAEGVNLFSVMAIDSLGSANSAVRTVTRDTVPPAKLILDTPMYHPGTGLGMTWKYPTSGKLATSFRLFWHTAPFASVAQATGSTVPLSSMIYSLQGLATGNYWFTVVGYDSVGNASPMSDLVQGYYDAVPPIFNIAFDKASPVGVGPVRVILSASKSLSGLPAVTVQPYGMNPSMLTVSNSALNIYEGTINVNTFLSSGLVRFNVSASDTLGNTFNGQPTGSSLVIDVTPPNGVVSTSPLGPVQTTNSVNVAVNLRLTEVPKGGTTPTLNFIPPTGAAIPLVLSGSGSNWSGTLPLAPGMGSGIGHFTMTLSDALDNVGHNITAGSSLEIYNTALPTPPGQPVHFTATPQSGGRVSLSWDAVANAEIYRVYADPGTNQYLKPVDMIADNVATNTYTDLPATDGSYMYAVTALRRGAEGTNSITRVAVSDRTPPSTPTNVVVGLVASGLQITWQAGAGELPTSYKVYRNGTLIRTVNSVTPVIDNPPRGIMSYTVGGVDSLGNETISAPATMELLVGAVNNMQALVQTGTGPALSWTSSDGTAVGFNIYRKGIKQNSSLVSSNSYNDSLPIGTELVTYAVRAVNSTNAESAARSVDVYPVDLALLLNSMGTGTNNAPVTRYFDDYQITVTNRAGVASLPLRQLEIRRTMSGASALDLVSTIGSSVSPGAGFGRNLAVPSAQIASDQFVRLRAVQETDIGGSSVIYQAMINFASVQTSGGMIEISANQLPLAGGLTPFDVMIYNRGYTPMYFATARGNGANPGDLYISVKNSQGQEVSRTAFTGSPAGTIFAGGVGYLMVPVGGSTRITVPSVLVPEAMASNTVTFEAVVSAIYDRATSSGQQASGPLSGSVQSSLAQTPYFGSAQTDHPLYSDDTPIIITGQALDRLTGLPKANVPLKIGFATRGYRWTRDVTTDGSGNYSYSYSPTPGMAGSLRIWAAHPDVFDQLNQVEITIYRVYVSPNLGDIRMSKNDSLRFSLSLLNPGDTPLTGFAVQFSAYQMVGTNQIPTTSMHGVFDGSTNFSLAAGERRDVHLRLIADADAPTNVVAVFKLVAAEGASATFTGYANLLEPVPLLAVLQPDVGYVEVSLNRGTLVSRQVTVMNRGLKDLKGVTMTPPTNSWIIANLPADTNGLITLPDLPVGGSNTFSVVFAPPTNTVMDYYHDKLTIRGTNSAATFDVGLYARVTSANTGSVLFYVDNILGLDVPNATVRLRNTLLQIELPSATTDINGFVTVTNMQEGDWSWQISAPGHSANVGVINVIAGQTVEVATRLSKSVVTINFTVVPVPYTDRYEIKLEQTFETHVPVPVLVLTPNYVPFENVEPGFQANFIVTAKNEGLIQMENLTITGQRSGTATLTPLITYVPYLLPQQSVEIPFSVTYMGTNAPTQQGSPFTECWPSPFAGLDLIGPFLDGLRALAEAAARCGKDGTAIAVAGSVAITMMIVRNAMVAALPLPYKIAIYVGCVLGRLFGDSGPGGGSGPPGSGGAFVPGGPPCFAADTRVLMADGTLKTIDQIQSGEKVRTGPRPSDVAVVADALTHPSDKVRRIDFSLPRSGVTNSVRATDEHLFWVDGQGWVEARGLHVGDWLFQDQNKRVQVTSSERVPGSMNVFTLRLRGDSAFYANGVLVHDMCGWWTPNGPIATTVRPQDSMTPTETATSNAQ